MQWIFNHLMFVVGIVSIVGLGSGLAALGVDEDKHQDLEENLRVFQVIAYLVMVYLSVLILDHTLLVSLPAYMHYTYLPATVKGVLSNMTSKPYLVTTNVMVTQVNALAILGVVLLISTFDIRNRLKEVNQ